MAFNPYYGGGFERRPPPNLGLQAYLGDPNSPLFNSPQFTPRTGGDLRGVQSFGSIEQPAVQNVQTVGEQIDANVKNMAAAKELHEFAPDPEGILQNPSQIPARMEKFGSSAMDFGRGIWDNVEDIGTEARNLFTGQDLPTNAETLQGLQVGAINRSPMGNVATRAAATTPTTAPQFTQGGHPMGLGDKYFNPSSGDPFQRSLMGEAGFTVPQAGGTMYSSPDLFTGASSPISSGSSPFFTTDLPNVGSMEQVLGGGGSLSPESISEITSQFGEGLMGAGTEAQALAKVGQPDIMAQGAEDALATEAATEAGGSFGKVMPYIGMGLSAADMMDQGVTVSNAMNMATAIAFANSWNPVGWTMMAVNTAGNLFDWW